MLNGNAAPAFSLFTRMRRRLTLRYSIVLIVFLTLFVAIVYGLLFAFVWNDQRSHLNGLADSEIHILQDWVNHDNNPNRLPPRSIEDAFFISGDQAFYYLLAENGNLQLGGEIQPQLREQVMGLIEAGYFRERKMEKVTLQTFGAPIPAGQIGTAAGRNGIFLVTDRDLVWNGQRIGKLYVGKEVTFQQILFRYLLILLVGLALLFFALIVWLSHYMSRRAILPVEKAYDRQREFTADASHELRTPLSVLMASIEALQMEACSAAAGVADGTESKTAGGGGDAMNGSFARDVLEGMKEEVRSMTKLTGDLLHLARSDSGDFVLDCRLFDVKESVDRVVDKLRPLADARGVAVKVFAPGVVPMNWDAERMSQLLVLLIDNAIKYTPQGGSVAVTLKDETARGQRRLMIEVKDNGIGIPPEALPRIFDRFYRQDLARSRETGGHGLGLAIAKEIVETGRGTIQVDSKVGEGSTFTVSLPLPHR
ncbi:MAG: two-component sensor histidine kinase [Paenibacillaceae bacterium]|jgi:signal transduction histidine kinase|nr:two-component sensor histidine kinase [Paenibacillaceae bacterium]